MAYEGPPPKRTKPAYVDVETPSEFFETSNTPSKVLHIADLSTKAQDPDLLETFSKFGRVSYIVIKRQPKNVALLEYEAVDGASSAMLYVQTTPIYVCSQKINIHYSALEKIPRFGFETDQPNKVLVILVTNVQFNINANTLHDICKPHGTVLRIAIVKRTPNITALVEFDTVEAARSCKYGINGADIYTNCCTLKVEYSKIPNVKILYPDEDHIDFTQPVPGESHSTRKTLMGPPPEYRDTRQFNNPEPGYVDYRDSGYGPGPYRDAHFHDSYRDGRPAYRDYPSSRSSYEHPHPSHYDERRGPYSDFSRQARLPSSSELMRGGNGCVLIIGGIDQAKMNCDRLFNLLCIYGNVLRVMFMKKKTELALVEMGDSWQAREAIQNLRRIEFLGMDVEVSLSNQNCVNPIQEPFTLSDGSVSYKDFSLTKLNRYMTRDHAGKNRPCPPQSSLHWFNAPPEMNEEKLAAIFKEYGAPNPCSITLHQLPSGRSTAGTVEFNSVREATEALVLANHAPVETSLSSTPFVVKLAYTKARGHRGPGQHEEADSAQPNLRPH